mgnify:FL=1|tara:strand:+ start:706 stop:996 length:291 start_codon:yes stop_codon:yes gene_type:complete
MSIEETVDQGSSRWSNKVLAYIFISLLFGSNILNSYINTQYHHEIKIEENKLTHIKELAEADKANRRRLIHAVEKQDFKNTIKDLNRELKKCKDER